MTSCRVDTLHFPWLACFIHVLVLISLFWSGPSHDLIIHAHKLKCFQKVETNYEWKRKSSKGEEALMSEDWHRLTISRIWLKHDLMSSSCCGQTCRDSWPRCCEDADLEDVIDLIINQQSRHRLVRLVRPVRPLCVEEGIRHSDYSSSASNCNRTTSQPDASFMNHMGPTLMDFGLIWVG